MHQTSAIVSAGRPPVFSFVQDMYLSQLEYSMSNFSIDLLAAVLWGIAIRLVAYGVLVLRPERSVWAHACYGWLCAHPRPHGKHRHT